MDFILYTLFILIIDRLYPLVPVFVHGPNNPGETGRKDIHTHALRESEESVGSGRLRVNGLV